MDPGMPGDMQVVHHTLVFAVQDVPSNGVPIIPGLSLGSGGRGGPSVRALTRVENGGARIVTSMLTEYARGNDGDIFDDGQAKMLAAGSSLRWQFHYHPNGKTTVTDRTRVGIKFWPRGWQPRHLISTMALASPETLAIPPGDPAARSDSYFPLAGPARLLSYQPHMHYRGKRMVLEAILPTRPGADAHRRESLHVDVADHLSVQEPSSLPERHGPSFNRVSRQLGRQQRESGSHGVRGLGRSDRR